MQFIINKKIWKFLGSLLLAVILFWAVISGVQNGKNIVQAESTGQNAQTLAQGFNFFYQDQNRFPAASEFQDNNLMGQYFTGFPPLSFISSVCPESFLYRRPSLTSFELDFCLPTGSGAYNKGWNKINEQK